jgi:hypothetical protein
LHSTGKPSGSPDGFFTSPTIGGFQPFPKWDSLEFAFWYKFCSGSGTGYKRPFANGVSLLELS